MGAESGSKGRGFVGWRGAVTSGLNSAVEMGVIPWERRGEASTVRKVEQGAGYLVGSALLRGP